MAGNRKGSFYSHPSSTIGRHEALSPIDLPAAESLDYQKPPLLLDQFSEFFFLVFICIMLGDVASDGDRGFGLVDLVDGLPR